MTLLSATRPPLSLAAIRGVKRLDFYPAGAILITIHCNPGSMDEGEDLRLEGDRSLRRSARFVGHSLLGAFQRTSGRTMGSGGISNSTKGRESWLCALVDDGRRR